MDCAERMLQIMELLEVPGPYYLLVALLNVKGTRVTSARRDHFLSESRTIDLENLILPEVLLENADVSIENEMRTSFGMIWNACGWRRSFSYDENGAYDEKWRSAFSDATGKNVTPFVLEGCWALDSLDQPTMRRLSKEAKRKRVGGADVIYEAVESFVAKCEVEAELEQKIIKFRRR